MKLNICMLLPLRYSQNMRVNPQIGICSYLTNFGHEVSWVLLSENHRSAQQFLFNSVHVYASPYIRHITESSLTGEIFNRILSILKKVCLILKIFRKYTHRYDIIFVRDGAFDGLVACYLKQRYKIPLVYELSDPLEQEGEDHKIEGQKPVFLWYLMAKTKALLKLYIMKRADLILPTTRWFDKGLVKKGISKSKLLPCPNGVNIKSFLNNKAGKDIREKYCLGNSRVIIYIGTMGKARELNVLIRAFSKVKKKYGSARLLMVGDGTDRKNLEKLAGELKVGDDVIFTGQVPQSKIPSFIEAADIGVSPVPSLSFYKVSSPIKMLEYMAMGKPVVANEEILEQKEVINDSGGGILVKFEDKSFVGGIMELLNNPEKAREMGEKGREWVVKNRSYEVLANRLEERYFELVNTYKQGGK